MFEQGNSSNRQEMKRLLFSPVFTAEFELVFFLIQENTLSQRLYFKANKKSIDSSKNSTRDLQDSAPFKRLTYFYLAITGNFERFQYFNYEKDFTKNKHLFQEKMEYRFLAENTKIENATLPYQTILSEANVKRNRMVSTNGMRRQVEYGGQYGSITENRFLPVTTLLF